MCLFARHHAWLHSRPGKQPTTRYTQFTGEIVKSQLLEYPTIEHGQYLLDYAFEIGPSKSTGSGPAVIDWVDIKAWVELNKLDLDSWELLVVREISKAFVSQYYTSEGAIVPPPYQPANTDTDTTSKRIGNLFRGLIARKSK